MKSSLSALSLAGALSLAVGCSSAKHPDAGQSAIRVSSHTQVSTAAHENTDTGDICATFSLTPYSFDADGNPVQAGTAVTFTTSNTSAATDQILGCIEGSDTFDYVAPTGSAYTSGSYNWAYLVSATNFHYCDPNADPALDLSTLTAASAYFAPVECAAGVDTPLSIDYPVSIAEPNSGGYIDISAGVDSVNQYIGCKQAEMVSNPNGSNAFHFGQSFTADNKPNVPWGILGYTVANTAADTNVSQYGGQVFGADPTSSSDTLYDSYYTGQFNNDNSGLPSSLFQTFLTNDPGIGVSGEEKYDYGLCMEHGGECDAWVDTRHAMCVTTQNTDGTFTTNGLLADAFIFIPSMGFAAASVTTAGSQITLYSQVLPNSGDDYSLPNDSGATMSGSPGFASTSSNFSSQAGFNDGLLTTTLNVSDHPGVVGFTGIYIDPINIGQFIVGGMTATTNVWASLADTGSGWTIGDFSDVTTAPEGFAEEQTGCLTLCGD